MNQSVFNGNPFLVGTQINSTRNGISDGLQSYRDSDYRAAPSSISSLMANPDDSEDTVVNQKLYNAAQTLVNLLRNAPGGSLSLQLLVRPGKEDILLTDLYRNLGYNQVTAMNGIVSSDTVQYAGIRYAIGVMVINATGCDFRLPPIVAIGATVNTGCDECDRVCEKEIAGFWIQSFGQVKEVVLCETEVRNSRTPVLVVGTSDVISSSNPSVPVTVGYLAGVPVQQGFSGVSGINPGVLNPNAMNAVGFTGAGSDFAVYSSGFGSGSVPGIPY